MIEVFTMVEMLWMPQQRRRHPALKAHRWQSLDHNEQVTDRTRDLVLLSLACSNWI